MSVKDIREKLNEKKSRLFKNQLKRMNADEIYIMLERTAQETARKLLNDIQKGKKTIKEIKHDYNI